MSAGFIYPCALESARCAELASRARRLRQRARAIRAGAPSVFTSAAEAEALARGLESQLRMAADTALAEAQRRAGAA